MFVTDKAVTAGKPSLRVRIAQGGAERLRRHWDEPLDLPDPETVSVKLNRRPLVHADTRDLRVIRCDHVSAAVAALPARTIGVHGTSVCPVIPFKVRGALPQVVLLW